MAALAASHPQLATWKIIGSSWERAMLGAEAGYPISVLAITN